MVTFDSIKEALLVYILGTRFVRGPDFIPIGKQLRVSFEMQMRAKPPEILPNVEEQEAMDSEIEGLLDYNFLEENNQNPGESQGEEDIGPPPGIIYSL